MKCGSSSLCSPSSPLKPPSSASAISSWDALTTRTTIDLERVRHSVRVNTDLACRFVMDELRAFAKR